MGLLANIQLAEAVQPEGHKLGADLGLRQLFTGDPILQFFLCCFQLIQSCFRGLGENTLLDSIQQISDRCFRFPKLLFIHGQIDVVPVLQIHEHGNDGFNSGIVHDHLHGFADHQIFDPFFLHRFLAAVCPLLFHGHALVVVVNIPCMAGSAFTAEVGPAVTAEQFCSQQIIVLGLVAGRGFLVLRQLFLYPVKQVLGDDSGDTVRDHSIPVDILTDIAAVVQKVLDAVVIHGLAAGVL